MVVRRELQVGGIVQGVGFRPHVYRLATERRLSGYIRNTSAGVVIEVQGTEAEVADFVAHLTRDAPMLARPTAVAVRDLPCGTEAAFAILPSLGTELARALIAPDVATCRDCLRELFDGRDRRYLYPFINCTNCGPRYTIVRGIPYDRARTSMAAFPMCAACQREYEDPGDRRFHAQANACWDCGPRVALWDAAGRTRAVDAIAAAAAILQRGGIVAVKGLGGFHLAADAANGASVQRLRARKRRGDKPLAVMLADMAIAEEICQLGAAEREALAGWRQPIVLAARREGGGLSPDLAPGQGELGIFLPYTPLHHLLFAAGSFRALVMTSGNLSDEPMATENAEAAARLGKIADAFLVHDREIVQGCDDSVVRPIGGDLRPVRRSRGWAPTPVRLGREVPPVLAVGGELKNSVCLARGREAFLSQHIGSVDNVAAETFFAATIRHLRRILEIEPEVVAHDLHPDYRSTRWALAQTHWRAVAVQHHHAHIAACMAENGLEGEVIGLALDGTGYGADGAIWGGEALVASYADFHRVGQIEYLPLPGGEAAIREPWRMGLAWLLHAFGPEWQRLDVPFVRGLEPEKARVVARMIARKIHCPQTSSCGRLFDAVAALTGVCQRVSYEAQAAMELETLASRAAGSGVPRTEPGYPMALERREDRWQMGITPLVRAVVADLQKGTEAGAVAWRFHAGLAESWIEMAEAVRRDTGLGRVCLSGGSCNNRLLSERMETGLQERGFEVFVHRQVPPGDGGLCLGQALVAAAQMQAGR